MAQCINHSEVLFKDSATGESVPIQMIYEHDILQAEVWSEGTKPEDLNLPLKLAGLYLRVSQCINEHPELSNGLPPLTLIVEPTQNNLSEKEPTGSRVIFRYPEAINPNDPNFSKVTNNLGIMITRLYREVTGTDIEAQAVDP
jgi:hypothetical protein